MANKLLMLLNPFKKIENRDTVLDVVYCSFSQRINAVAIDLMALLILCYPIFAFIGAIIYWGHDYLALLTTLREQYPPYDEVPSKILLESLSNDGFFWRFFLNTFTGMVITVALYIYFTYKFSGTPGKMILGYKVVDATTLKKPTLRQSVYRSLGYFLSALPLFIGFFMVVFTKRSQGLHDLIANTVVIEAKHDFTPFEHFVKKLHTFLKKQFKRITWLKKL